MELQKRMRKEEVNWDEQPLKNWLDSIMREATKQAYRSAYRAYHEYTKKTSVELIDEAIEDSKKDPRERKNFVLNSLIGFYKYLKEEYTTVTETPYKGALRRKGLADKSAQMFVNAVRSFYSKYDITVRLKGASRLPIPEVLNKRFILNTEQLKTLLTHARTPRDRAVFLVMFQAGLDDSTVCSMKYNAEIVEGLKKNDSPMKLELVRKKTGVTFYTFIGRDSIEALKVYLKDLESRSIKLEYDSPLFISERGKVPLRPANIRMMFKEAVHKAGFNGDILKGRKLNPHALRESFGSILANAGVPSLMVDEMLGHKIGGLQATYQSLNYNEVLKAYADHEKLLSVYGNGNGDIKKLRAEIETEIKGNYKKLQQMFNDQFLENKTMKTQMIALQQELGKKDTELKNAINQLAEKSKVSTEEVESLVHRKIAEKDAQLKQVEDRLAMYKEANKELSSEVLDINIEVAKLKEFVEGVKKLIHRETPTIIKKTQK